MANNIQPVFTESSQTSRCQHLNFNTQMHDHSLDLVKCMRCTKCIHAGLYIYASTAWCLTPGIKRTYTIQMLYRHYTDATCISEADWMVAGLGSHLPNNLLHMQCSQPGFAQSTGQTKNRAQNGLPVAS